jgi:hypothetical protein
LDFFFQTDLTSLFLLFSVKIEVSREVSHLHGSITFIAHSNNLTFADFYVALDFQPQIVFVLGNVAELDLEGGYEPLWLQQLRRIHIRGNGCGREV